MGHPPLYVTLCPKNGPKWQKIVLSHSISQEPYIMWLLFMVHLWKMIISSVIFFHFFKILIFWVHSGVKWQKTVQNDKKFCLSCSISQKPYIMWLSFIVQICKMISPGVFFFFNFKILIFQVMGLKVQKIAPNDKILSVSLCSSGTVHHMIVIFNTHV